MILASRLRIVANMTTMTKKEFEERYQCPGGVLTIIYVMVKKEVRK